jgi:hypothetical protein
MGMLFRLRVVIQGMVAHQLRYPRYVQLLKEHAMVNSIPGVL